MPAVSLFDRGIVRQSVIGPWPMQLVVPRAVKAAVRMLTMTCRMVFQVSFFIVLSWCF